MTIICDRKDLKLLSQTLFNSVCSSWKVKHQVEGNTIMSKNGFMLQFIKIKETEKQEKCAAFSHNLSRRYTINYPDMWCQLRCFTLEKQHVSNSPVKSS